MGADVQDTLPAVPAPPIQLTQASLDLVMAALEFYANGDNKEMVTFEKGKREAQLAKLNADKSWTHVRDDFRGHEIYEENGHRAEAALEHLRREIDRQDEEREALLTQPAQ